MLVEVTNLCLGERIGLGVLWNTVYCLERRCIISLGPLLRIYVIDSVTLACFCGFVFTYDILMELKMK